jgi:hypothetical protein
MTTIPVDAEELEALRHVALCARDYPWMLKSALQKLDAIRARQKGNSDAPR